MNTTYDNEAVMPTSDDLSVTSDISAPVALIPATDEIAENKGVYKLVLSKPVTYNNVVITEIKFDWASLTGDDHMAIENEMLAFGKFMAKAKFSGEFIKRMAARASTPRVGVDFFGRVTLLEYDGIRNAAYDFFPTPEQ